MEEKQLSLAQLSDYLDHLQSKMQKYFETFNSADAVSFKRDAYFGKRHINIPIRLDEFSLTKLENTLPKLKALFQEYKHYRTLEAKELDRVAIERQIRQQIDPAKHLY
jgi:hypothetical protein